MKIILTKKDLTASPINDKITTDLFNLTPEIIKLADSIVYESNGRTVVLKQLTHETPKATLSVVPELRMVTCRKCGWVHMAVTKQHAIEEVCSFNTYFDKLPKNKQDACYGGRKASLETYLCCMSCGGSYKNFRDSEPGDCPSGCTINPIMDRNEE